MNFPLRAGRSKIANQEGGSVAVKELTACLLAVFNRQCISKAFVYMFHNEPLFDDDRDEEDGDDMDEEDDETAIDAQESFNVALVRGMKYGVLSPNGIGAKLKPYMEKVLQQGYLTPADYESSVFATHAVCNLYPLVHAAWQAGGESGVKQWSLAYSMEILTDPNVVVEEALLAADLNDDGTSEGSEGEPDSSIENLDKTNTDKMESSVSTAADAVESMEESSDTDAECRCEFCVEMRSMDNIDLGQIESDDPLSRLMIASLQGAISNE